MWDLPGLWIEPVAPALAGRLLTTEPPGKPHLSLNVKFLGLISSHVSTFCLPYTLVPSNKTGGFAQQYHWNQGLLPPAIDTSSKWAPLPLPGSLKAVLADMERGYPGVVEETRQNWLYQNFCWDWLFWHWHFPGFIHPCCPASINSGGFGGVHGISTTCMHLCACFSLSFFPSLVLFLFLVLIHLPWLTCFPFPLVFCLLPFFFNK